MVPEYKKNMVKEHWQAILGADKSGKGAICPSCGSGTGKNGTGLTQVPGSYELKCFACDNTHDVFGWYAIKRNLDVKHDFNQIYRECCELAGIDPEADTPSKAKATKASKAAVKTATKKSEPALNLTPYYKECAARLHETDYWSQRGLSEETCKHFLVGFDPQWKHPSWSEMCTRTPRLIVPIDKHCYLARDTRSNDFFKKLSAEEKKQAWNNPKSKCNRSGGESKIPTFHKKVLDQYDVIITVEGEIDAMSIYEVGFPNVVATGSISYRDMLIDALYHTKKRPKAMIVAFDNETSKSVIAAKRDLEKALKKLGINFVDGTDISGGLKDANELLIADREQLKANVRRLVDFAESLPPIESEDEIKARERAAKEAAKASKEGKQSKGRKSEGEPVDLTTTTELTWTYTARQIFGSAPLDIRIPDKYTVDEGGIIGDGIVCTRTPVIPFERIINHHTGDRKYTLALYLKEQKRWQEIEAEATTIMDHHRIIDLVKKGLATTSGIEAKTLATYLYDTIALNNDIIIEREEIHQPGWSSDMKEFRLPNRGDCYMPSFAQRLSSKGTLEQWSAKAREVCKSPIARLMLSTAFAAPLLRVLKMRSFGLYLYGPSKGGKTACQSFALSVWGDPIKMKRTFNTTMNGLEAAAEQSNDLPFLVDELMQADEKFRRDGMSFIVCNEQGRGRSDKTGQARPIKEWRVILLCNGEHRYFDDASKEGARNRLVEVEMGTEERVFDDEEYASGVHRFIVDCHGTAGNVFLDKLMEYGFERVEKDFNTLYEMLTKEYYPKYPKEYLRMLAVTGLGDAYRANFVTGEYANMCLVETKRSLIDKVIHRIPTAAMLVEYTRAWAKLRSFIMANKYHFYGEHLNGDPTNIDMPEMRIQSPVYGEIRSDENHVVVEYIIERDAVQECLKKAGFAPAKMLKAFAAHNWIEKDKDGKDPKRIWPGAPKERRPRMIVITPKNLFEADEV